MSVLHWLADLVLGSIIGGGCAAVILSQIPADSLRPKAPRARVHKERVHKEKV